MTQKWNTKLQKVVVLQKESFNHIVQLQKQSQKTNGMESERSGPTKNGVKKSTHKKMSMSYFSL